MLINQAHVHGICTALISLLEMSMPMLSHQDVYWGSFACSTLNSLHSPFNFFLFTSSELQNKTSFNLNNNNNKTINSHAFSLLSSSLVVISSFSLAYEGVWELCGASCRAQGFTHTWQAHYYLSGILCIHS